MRLPRFTTLDLFFATTLVALFVGLFTSAWRWRPVWILTEEHQSNNPVVVQTDSAHVLITHKAIYVDAIPTSARAVPAATFLLGFSTWAAAWGIVRKRGRESFAVVTQPSPLDNFRERLPTPSPPPPLAMRLCWGLMIAGGLVALAIPIAMMFIVGPWLFPTLYFSLLVGIAAISGGAAGDATRLKRTAVLQLANMIALDVVNVVFAAMEYALLRTDSARDYLREQQRATLSPKTATRAAALSS